MSYAAAGYEDDWDDDEFDFGDHCDPDYSSDSLQPQSKLTKHFENGASVKLYDVPPTSAFKNTLRIGDGFGSPSTLKSTAKLGTAGRGRGKSWRVGSSKAQDNFQSKKDVSSTKIKGQGNFLFTRTKDKTQKNYVNEKNSQIAEDFRAAIVNENIDVIKNVLEKGTISVDCILKSGWTGLMHAVSCGLPEVATILIQHGANVNFQKDMFSVIMAACSSECDAEDKVAACLSTLVENGAKINSHDRYHMTPLMYACRKGREKMVEILLCHKPEVNKQDQRGWTALGWAASRGHGRIVRMLLDENANPKLYTNDGQSAEDLAYGGGFTIIADVLHNIVNPNRRMDQSSQNCHSSEITAGEEGNCVRYGDLELFLFGLELGHLVPLFQDHKITFDGFLQLTDAELQQIGVGHIGIRKKILTATRDVHTKEWDLSSLPSETTNQITSDDLNVVLGNVEKHLHYIKCSIGYVNKSLNGTTDPTNTVKDGEHAKHFLGKTEDVLTEISGISDEITRLQFSVKEISTKVPNAPADLISKKTNTYAKQETFTHFPVVLVAGFLAVGLTAVWLSKDR